jgi:hypothetical protein
MVGNSQLIQINLPKEILTTERIVRTVQFSSKQNLTKLSLTEKVLLF